MNKKYFFASDYHFKHPNVIIYDNRPFIDINHMADVIIEKHNSVVGPNDDFYFLGDFCFDRKSIGQYIRRMNGNKFFIKGNHDRSRDIAIWTNNGVNYLGEQCKIVIEEIEIVLNHFSMRVWDKHHRGAIHLFGHSHGSLDKFPNGRSMDVFIGNNDYYPYELTDIMKIMINREKHIIDHHI